MDQQATNDNSQVLEDNCSGLNIETDFIKSKDTVIKKALMQNCDYLKVISWLLKKEYLLLHTFVRNVVTNADKFNSILDLQEAHVEELLTDIYDILLHLNNDEQRQKVVEVVLSGIMDRDTRKPLLYEYWRRYVKLTYYNNCYKHEWAGQCPLFLFINSNI